MESASKIASEAISNVRTVQSMGIERKIMSRYTDSLEQAQTAGGDKSRLRGAVFGLGLTAPTLGYAISLTFAGYRIAYGGMPYKTAILISEALLYGSWMLGQALSFAPNFSSARNSGARVISMMRRAPLIHDHPDAKDPENWQANGEIQFKSVEFSYPSRRGLAGSEPVLRGLNLLVSPGKTVALVGHSGCGKSTCIQLLQRFYDSEEGNIELDNKDIVKCLPLRRLRSQLGIVQQEPVLFDKTIAENIAYGDNSRQVGMDEIVKAAIAANVHSFITGLPQGYETRLGTKGAQLSGGQKQRIAIARALVRNPRVLLLDEATSALDTQSEKLVQQALDSAKEGRTCIVIAHRLATIQNADAICVLERGRVAEKGTHLELMQRRGLYYELHQTNA